MFLLMRYSRSCSICLVLLCSLAATLQAQDFDLRSTSKSPLEMYISNKGGVGYNETTNRGGLFYPRNSPTKHLYLMGSGIWFGARKLQVGGMRKMSIPTYDLQGESSFIPGTIRDGDTLFSSYPKQYGVYVSTDYNAEGASSGVRRWAIWDNAPIDSAVLGKDGYWGNFVYEGDKRNKKDSKSPAYISAEDIVCLYKDSDVNWYEMGKFPAIDAGYPIGIEVLQRVFTWDSGELASTAIIAWEFRNTSKDTLFDCWMGYIADADIAPENLTEASAQNDHTGFVRLPGTHGLRYGWTDTNAGEDAATVGVLGIALIETPARDSKGMGVVDTVLAHQRGTVTAQAATLSSHAIPDDDIERYDYLAEGKIVDSPSSKPDDLASITATGPFHLAPNGVLRFAVCLSIGGLSKDVKAGDTTTIAPLIANLRAAFQRYYGVLKTTAVQDVTVGEETLSLSPNPATERVDLRIVLAAESNLQLRLYNSLGQELRTAEFALPAGEQQLHLDCSDLPNGSYTLLLSNKGHQYTRNFVVLH